MSLPLREAWIEMRMLAFQLRSRLGRFPCGKRGLKCHIGSKGLGLGRSLPLREAWIEINVTGTIQALLERHFPCGKRGLK